MKILGMGRGGLSNYSGLRGIAPNGQAPGLAKTVKRQRVRKMRREGKRLDKNGGGS